MAWSANYNNILPLFILFRVPFIPIPSPSGGWTQLHWDFYNIVDTTNPMPNAFKSHNKNMCQYNKIMPGPASAVEELRTTEWEDPGSTPDKGS
jgi:hypothetical protein